MKVIEGTYNDGFGPEIGVGFLCPMFAEVHIDAEMFPRSALELLRVGDITTYGVRTD
jgi:hypothetical protein